jgi:hypothetical protein
MGAKENQTISDWTLWLLAAVLFLLPMWRVGYYDVGMFLDDAGIVFVYAHNLLETGLIFYNVPADRLDGFTSFIDVLFAVPLALFAPDAMYSWNFYIKALITSAIPVFIFFLLLRWGLSRVPAFLLAAALASSDVLSAAFGMQLEGPLYALGIVAFFACLFNREKNLTVGLAVTGWVLCLTRPEAPALVALALGLVVCLDADKQRRMSAFYAGLTVGAALFAWYAWRIFYFGFWAPNTYYAKMSGSRLQELSDGFEFVSYHFLNRADVFLYLALFVLILGCGRAVFSADRGERLTDCLVAGLVALGMLGVRLLTGGDSYQISARLLLDFALPAVLAIGLSLSVYSSGVMRNIIAGLVVMALLGNALFLARNFPANIAAGFVRMERASSASLSCERSAVRRVHVEFPNARLAHTDFQRAKYFASDLELIDLSGLNNKEIAHRTEGNMSLFGKHDLQYALDANVELWKIGNGVMARTALSEQDWPEVVRTGEGVGERFRDALPFMQANAAAFTEGYAPLTVLTSCDTYLNLLVRRDLISADSLFLDAG